MGTLQQRINDYLDLYRVAKDECTEPKSTLKERIDEYLSARDEGKNIIFGEQGQAGMTSDYPN